AILVTQWFPGIVGQPGKEQSAPARPAREPERERIAVVDPTAIPVPDEPEAPNKPLTWALQGVNPDHPYLVGRGSSREMCEYFGVGYFAGRGIMSGRIVIPIHNVKGELVGYAGRWPGDSGWPEKEDKYKLPSGYRKTQDLFNLHRALKTQGRGVVV